MRITQLIFFVFWTTIISSYCHAQEASTEELLIKHVRFTPEEAKKLMAQPIPAHAQKEIDYGFVDEDFVRLMMGIQTIYLKTDRTNWTTFSKTNPVSRINYRYTCASMGTNDFMQELSKGSFPASSCVYFWPKFLEDGAEVPFEIDFPLVEHREPWSTPSIESVNEWKRLAKESLDSFPLFMHEDLLSLRVDWFEALKILHTLKNIPDKDLNMALLRIESQSPKARRFGRLICTRDARWIEPFISNWNRTCYAYWSRYLKMGSD